MTPYRCVLVPFECRISIATENVSIFKRTIVYPSVPIRLHRWLKLCSSRANQQMALHSRHWKSLPATVQLNLIWYSFQFKSKCRSVATIIAIMIIINKLLSYESNRYDSKREMPETGLTTMWDLNGSVCGGYSHVKRTVSMLKQPNLLNNCHWQTFLNKWQISSHCDKPNDQ